MIGRERAEKRLAMLFRPNRQVFAIHYASESLADKPSGYFPRVLAIAVKNLTSGDIQVFSIAKVADRLHIAKNELDTRLDHLERTLLDEFFSFLQGLKSVVFVHWNMRDNTFGFPAIYHRYEVLGGKPIHLKDESLCNLAEVLSEIYGPNYVKHPRFESLIRLNGITMLGFVRGQDEPALFQKREFVRLQTSTLRKVECIASILKLQLAGDLKVSSRTLGERIRNLSNHPTTQIVVLVSALASIFGLIITVVALLWG
jgi:hypothetical protein